MSWCRCSGPDANPNDAMPGSSGGRPGELCGVALGNALIALFRHVPEAWRAVPSVNTQCSDPGNPILPSRASRQARMDSLHPSSRRTLSVLA